MQNAKSQIRNICSDPMKFYEGDDAADLLRNDAFLVANNTVRPALFCNIVGIRLTQCNFVQMYKILTEVLISNVFAHRSEEQSRKFRAPRLHQGTGSHLVQRNKTAQPRVRFSYFDACPSRFICHCGAFLLSFISQVADSFQCSNLTFPPVSTTISPSLITKLLSTLQKQKFEQERYEHSYVHFKTFIESKSRRKPDWLEDLSKLAGPKAFALSAGVSSKTSEAGQRRDFVESDPVEPEAV